MTQGCRFFGSRLFQDHLGVALSGPVCFQITRGVVFSGPVCFRTTWGVALPGSVCLTIADYDDCSQHVWRLAMSARYGGRGGTGLQRSAPTTTKKRGIRSHAPNLIEMQTMQIVAGRLAEMEGHSNHCKGLRSPRLPPGPTFLNTIYKKDSVHICFAVFLNTSL